MSPAVQSHAGLNAMVRFARRTVPPCFARWSAVSDRPAAGAGQRRRAPRTGSSSTPATPTGHLPPQPAWEIYWPGRATRPPIEGVSSMIVRET